MGRSANFVIWPSIVGLLYFGASFAVLDLARESGGFAVYWPASGILFAALMIAPKRAGPCHVATAAIASLAANLIHDVAMIQALGFTVANMVEPCLATWLLLRGGNSALVLRRSIGLGRLFFAAMAGAVASATIATIFATPADFAFFASWLATVLLGILIVAPVPLIIVEARAMARPLRDTSRALAEGLVQAAAIGLVTVNVFYGAPYPLLFLPVIAVQFAVVRSGAIGAAVGMLTVTLVASAATLTGHGPIAGMAVAKVQHVLFLQFYLVALLFSALPTAALLGARRRLTEELAERNRLLNLAEREAKVGHWRLDFRTGHLFWSPEVYRIYGFDTTRTPNVDVAMAAYHPDDRQELVDRIEQARVSGIPYRSRSRVVTPEGVVQHVSARGEVERSTDGDIIGLFGTIQDVSGQVEAEHVLQKARDTAEEAARVATRLAETDQLTDIANRRKAMSFLEAAIDFADGTGQALSIALFDVDHFKSVNDRFGHGVGDAVLQRVARSAAGAIRTLDLVGRIGGEEFLLVLPGAGVSEASEIAERVRAAVELGGNGDGDPKVTISLGLAEFHAGDSAAMLLKKVDEGLYRAKRDGRNRLCTAA